jgi:beta-lactamase regulating signal transducer with metallopeptidase domain
MLAAVPEASSGLLRLIGEAAARSLALGLLAALALAALRVKSISVKLLVWRGLLVAALAMPVLAGLVPAVRLPVPVPNSRAPGAAQASVPGPAVTLTKASQISGPPSNGPRKMARASQSARLSEASQKPPRRSPPIPWPIVLAAVYLAVAILLLARVFVGWRWGQRLQLASTPIADPSALRDLDACARAAELRTTPRLADSEILSVPVTLGARNPVILLPADWREWGEGELGAVLAHEVSHVGRRDALVERLALIHRAVFWFSPLAWWLERQLADLAEQASDEAALAAGADRSRYAETLLGFFAALEASSARAWWQGVSMAKAGQAEKRVDRILAWRGVMSNRLKKSLVVMLASVAAPAVVLMAAVHPAVYNFQEPALPSAPRQEPAPPREPTPPPPLARAAVGARPARQTLAAVPAIPTVPALTGVRPHAPLAPSAPVPPDQEQSTATKDSDTTITDRITGRYDRDDWGGRFVIVTKDSHAVTMSGTEEDARHARSLRSKIPGDFIWFERDEKSYIIRDQATVDRAKKFWEPEEELSKKQEELGKQQEALGKQQEELGEKMEAIRVKIPDLTAEMQKLEARMKQLSTNGGTVEEIGDLQGEIGELQSRIGEIQSDAGREQGELGRQQGELGRQQGALGRQQGELGRQQGELSRRATRQMQQLLNDALDRGLAQPE